MEHRESVFHDEAVPENIACHRPSSKRAQSTAPLPASRAFRLVPGTVGSPVSQRMVVVFSLSGTAAGSGDSGCADADGDHDSSREASSCTPGH